MSGMKRSLAANPPLRSRGDREGTAMTRLVITDGDPRRGSQRATFQLKTFSASMLGKIKLGER